MFGEDYGDFEDDEEEEEEEGDGMIKCLFLHLNSLLYNSFISFILKLTKGLFTQQSVCLLIL